VISTHDITPGHSADCVQTVVVVEEGPDLPARTRWFHDAADAQHYANEAFVAGNPVSINGQRVKEDDLV